MDLKEIKCQGWNCPIPIHLPCASRETKLIKGNGRTASVYGLGSSDSDRFPGGFSGVFPGKGLRKITGRRAYYFHSLVRWRTKNLYGTGIESMQIPSNLGSTIAIGIWAECPSSVGRASDMSRCCCAYGPLAGAVAKKQMLGVSEQIWKTTITKEQLLIWNFKPGGRKFLSVISGRDHCQENFRKLDAGWVCNWRTCQLGETP